MQIRRSWLAITIITLAVVTATAFVFARKDGDSELTKQTEDLFIVGDNYKVTNEMGTEIPGTRKTAKN